MAFIFTASMIARYKYGNATICYESFLDMSLFYYKTEDISEVRRAQNAKIEKLAEENRKNRGAQVFAEDDIVCSLTDAALMAKYFNIHAQDGGRRAGLTDEKQESKHHLIIAALICGIGMFGGTTLQQIGLVYTTAGKAGFISALYIVIIPLAGLLMHKKIKASVWTGVMAGAAGLYLLCVKGDFSIGFGDLLMIGSAFAYAVQIITVDHYAEKLNPIMLVVLEFTVCVALSIPLMLIFEDPQLSEIRQCIPQFLYTGVLSSGAAYTLQVFGQRDTDSVSASLILSSEAVISVIAGALFLGEHMTGRELIGCVLMMFFRISIYSSVVAGSEIPFR